MAERERVPLEPALRDVGRQLDVPASPDVTAAVRTRLEGLPSHGRRGWWRRVAAAGAAAVLAVAVTVTLSPQVRAAFVEVLRVAGIEIRGAPGPTPTPSGHGTLPDKRPVTLVEARRLAEFPVAVPDRLGSPDGVRVSGGSPPRVVSLTYEPGPRLPEPAGGVAARLDEFAGRAPTFEKYAAMEEDVELLSVNGHRGVWVSGPHRVDYVGRDGQWYEESARLAANTLIWQAGGVTLRLEGEFGKVEALAVARSLP